MICSPKPCVFSCKFAVIYKKGGGFFLKCTYPGKHCYLADNPNQNEGDTNGRYPKIEVCTSNGIPVQYKLADLKPCINCGAIPELLADRDNLTVVVYCPQCRVGTGFSVFGKAIERWNTYRSLLAATTQNNEGDKIHDNQTV